MDRFFFHSPLTGCTGRADGPVRHSPRPHRPGDGGTSAVGPSILIREAYGRGLLPQGEPASVEQDVRVRNRNGPGQGPGPIRSSRERVHQIESFRAPFTSCRLLSLPLPLVPSTSTTCPFKWKGKCKGRRKGTRRAGIRRSRQQREDPHPRSGLVHADEGSPFQQGFVLA